MNRTETRSVPRSHILVESLNSICSRHLTVLLVHVVGAGTRIVTDPDTEVLDLERALLVDLENYVNYVPNISRMNLTYHVQADDLTVGLLDLAELHQEVPEAGLGDHSVRRKYAHAVQLWRWVCLGGQMAADDLVFCEATCIEI